MSGRKLSAKLQTQVLRKLSSGSQASLSTVDDLIRRRKVPKDLGWQPSLCITRGDETILVHTLLSPDFPAYLARVIEKLRTRGFVKVQILVLARDLILEATEDRPPTPLPAPYAAARVAEQALSLGCGLAFEAEQSVHFVFSDSYSVPRRCRLPAQETGHVPKWLYEQLAASADFSSGLQKLLKRFATNYGRATQNNSIANDREAQLVLRFAKSFAGLDRRFFLPVEWLETLRQFEMSGATHARDHFFHTFNNLFLGFHILGKLFSGRKIISEVDRFIQNDAAVPKVNPWEILWFLTCLFHDPGYTAEKVWANFRFAFGVVPDAGVDDEIPEQMKKQIRNQWDSQYAKPRRDLHNLYNRAVRKWSPPTMPQKSADVFDEAIQKAYFDGRQASHSLISGLKLINGCRTQNVPRTQTFNPATALTACVIAALSMMFHDPKCRSALQAAGIPPIAFESLPYASVLMFVDSLQDDRRDISVDRFRAHGVLSSTDISQQQRTVNAEVCLREVSVKGWPGRIAEYESVMAWINKNSETRFTIDYRSRARLPN
jgi:hypothetical protein